MRRLSLFLFICLFCFSSLGWATGPKLPGNKDRCPVCGMFVTLYSDWVSTIVFKDDSQLFFDGPKDLFRYYFSLPNENDSRTRQEIAEIYLTDYYSTRLFPVGKLFLIPGSDVYGPMGNELIPVAGEDAAKTFVRDHKGSKILTFEQLTPQLIPGD